MKDMVYATGSRYLSGERQREIMEEKRAVVNARLFLLSSGPYRIRAFVEEASPPPSIPSKAKSQAAR